jgi:hypothetical protein
MPKVEWKKGDKVHELLELGSGSRFPFRFGRTKVRLLLEAIEKLGVDGFANRLQSFLEETEEEE